nr:beta-glucosidase [uncultured bacterium]
MRNVRTSKSSASERAQTIMTKIYAMTSSEITPEEANHEQIVKRAGGECVVLLENDGILPWENPGQLALYGMGARRTIKGGTGSGDVNTRSNTSIEQGLEAAGFEILTKSWLDRCEAEAVEAKRYYLEDYLPKRAQELGVDPFIVTFNEPFHDPDPTAISEADLASCDRAVYVISRNSGEGADRRNAPGDYQFSETEIAQMRQLANAYAEFAVVLNIGGVMDLSVLSEIEGVNAVVLMGQLGSVGGAVLADVLTGAVNPSGKLTDTWARAYEDYPSSAGFSSNDGNVDDEYYTEGIYVGYRYFDTFGVEPLYPFGFGRSYTTFQITPAALELDGLTVRVKATVKNTGDRAGKEVVQVYVSTPAGHLPVAYQSLVGFAKTEELAPGAETTVEIVFDVRDVASYCANHSNWALLGGNYVVRVGSCSRDTVICGVLTLAENTPFKHCKKLFDDSDPVSVIMPSSVPVSELPDGVPVLPIDPQDIPREAVSYTASHPELAAPTTDDIICANDVREGRASVEDLVAQLPLDELAEFCAGTLRADDGSLVGNASYTVPGAAGDTTSVIRESRGVKNLVMADGPAGLRLQPVFKTDLEGNLLPGGEVLGDSYTPFDPSLTDENSITYYQYCTAIPIGWSLAQSWNMPLLEELGSLVGQEMETFGVDIWLAPAFNIHRNPLCGRNFEYYSEDPVVSGKCAAAITRGVQSHQGRYTCIKHYAANNQEDNRYFTNSHINEQAIREIYLKGFGIAIRESQPGTIMTSYNLLNGIHTANSHDLLQAVARDEFGFEGFIMTDWFTSQDQPAFTGGSTKYPISASTGCVYAGNDVQMPGCRKNVTDIIEAVESGEALDGFSITLGDVQFCAANVIRLAIS